MGAVYGDRWHINRQLSFNGSPSVVLIQHHGFFIGTQTNLLEAPCTLGLNLKQFIKYSHLPNLKIVEVLNFVELLYHGAMERKQIPWLNSRYLAHEN